MMIMVVKTFAFNVHPGTNLFLGNFWPELKILPNFRHDSRILLEFWVLYQVSLSHYHRMVFFHTGPGQNWHRSAPLSPL